MPLRELFALALTIVGAVFLIVAGWVSGVVVGLYTTGAVLLGVGVLAGWGGAGRGEVR